MTWSRYRHRRGSGESSPRSQCRLGCCWRARWSQSRRPPPPPRPRCTRTWPGRRHRALGSQGSDRPAHLIDKTIYVTNVIKMSLLTWWRGVWPQSPVGAGGQGLPQHYVARVTAPGDGAPHPVAAPPPRLQRQLPRGRGRGRGALNGLAVRHEARPGAVSLAEYLLPSSQPVEKAPILSSSGVSLSSRLTLVKLSKPQRGPLNP